MAKVTYIPGEVVNAAVDENGNRLPVTRTQHIFDDTKGKSQAEVNADIDDSLNQLSDEIDAVNKQDYVPVDTLPAIADADPKKIYRVVDEVSYTDYMVNASGDGWKKIYKAEFPGIDDEPTAGSDNLVKSGGIENRISRNGTFLVNKGGLKELYLINSSFNIDDLHLVYKTDNNYHLRFFYNNNVVAVTKATECPEGYEGILNIYDYSTLGSTDVVIGYVIVDWHYWKSGTSAPVAALTDNVYNIEYSPTIYAFLNKKDIVAATAADNINAENIASLKSANFKEGQFIVGKAGIEELYIFDNSVGIKDLHLLYKTSGNYHLRFFNSSNTLVAQTIVSISNKGPWPSTIPDNYSGIIPIFDSSTLGSTDKIIGYVIVNWNYWEAGSSAPQADLTDNAFDIDKSPTIKLIMDELDDMYLRYLQLGKINTTSSPITAAMFDDTSALADALNTAFESYATLCKCSKYSFYPFNLADISNGRFVYKINHNFRTNVIADGMSNEEMAGLINYQFTIPINRFNDAVLNNTNGIKASIATGMPIGEPSAIVSDDESTLYIYCGCLYRYKSVDGMKYELDHQLTIGGETVTQSHPDYLMHCNVNKINGKYYLIGTHSNRQPLILWTSDDGWNFTKVGTLLEIGDEFNSEHETIGNFGNTFLHYDEGGLWYLYYEITKSTGAVGWEICVATCPNITVERETGKYGVWTQYGSNPILKAELYQYTSRTTGKGNPNLVCGTNNRPMKHDGKYFMYLHGNTSWGGVSIFRAFSENLLDWTLDGMVYNNRDVPTAGETAPGNGDHCIVEFKGRTLLFYTWDINDYPRPEQVKLTIDDRPQFVLLGLMC